MVFDIYPNSIYGESVLPLRKTANRCFWLSSVPSFLVSLMTLLCKIWMVSRITVSFFFSPDVVKTNDKKYFFFQRFLLTDLGFFKDLLEYI